MDKLLFTQVACNSVNNFCRTKEHNSLSSTNNIYPQLNQRLQNQDFYRNFDHIAGPKTLKIIRLALFDRKGLVQKKERVSSYSRAEAIHEIHLRG